eukprot:3604569-Heterocapsa_arctica.AAC.1
MRAQHRSAIIVPMLDEVNAPSICASIGNVIKLLSMHAQKSICDVPAAQDPSEFAMSQVP